MDAFAADVDPDERVAPFVIDCALADDVGGVEDQPRSHPALPLVMAADRRTQWPYLSDEKKEIDKLTAT